MAGPYNPNAVQVEMRYTCLGQQVENTLYFDFNSEATYADLVTLTEQLETWWLAEVNGLQHAEVNLNEIYAKTLIGPVAPEYTRLPPQPAPGLAIGQPCPNSVTLAMSFRSNTTGRSGRGRNYVIGLTELMVTNNEVNADVVASWQAAYAALFPGGGYITSAVWSIYSREQGGEPRLSGVLFPVFTVLATDPVVDSQRRRLPGRGK